MDVIKSTRHSRITGDFAECLVLYWLSKYGFECARVDHTGIDLIARSPHSNEVLGISVKARSRSTGTERSGLRIDNDEFAKVTAACEAFGCVPWFAIVVDAGSTITGFLMTMDHLLEMHPMGATSCTWSMARKWQQHYQEDSQIMRFVFATETPRWWTAPA